MLARDCFIVIDACSSIAFPVFSSCVLPRLLSETMRTCDRPHLRHQLLNRQGGAYIMRTTFSSLVPRYRIERFLDPTTSYLCLSNKPKQPCSPHPSKPLFGHVPCLLNHY